MVKTMKKMFAYGIGLILASRGAEFLYESTTNIWVHLSLLLSVLLILAYVIYEILLSFEQEKKSE